MIEVIYEDQDILVVNKPPGLVVFKENDFIKEEETLAFFLQKQAPEITGVGKERSGAAHRLDKNTSGVILFGKNENALLSLQKEILEKNAKKGYITLVWKNPQKDSGEISTFIDRSPKDRRKQRAFIGETGKRDAFTSYKVIERFQDYALLEVYIGTGRKHQIRCHMAHIGHPVAGDKLYRFKDQVDPENLTRQFLHAKSIEIKIPSGEIKKFNAPLSPDLEEVLKNLS